MVFNQKGFEDVCLGFRSYWLWFWPAIDEIKKKYSRSIIGPFWQTIAILFFIFSIGPLYSLIFSVNKNELIPYISIGFVLWIFIVAYLNDVCLILIVNESEIKSYKTYYSIFIYRCLLKNLIILLHSCIALVIIFPFYSNISNILYIELIIGIFINILFFFFLGLILSLLGCRFRDFSQIINSLLQFVFFITPILWIPNLSKINTLYLNFNPFYVLIEIIRNPLLGVQCSLITYLYSIAYLFILILLSTFFFNKKYKRIIFWI